ncbi:hypothetical protein PP568_13095 [Mycobacteroides abscessus]|uniref:Uncharacterized protein n=2 Tax=Mycobacteroides abscessus TaxID=36809 RepID=A0AB38D4H3_9MYCO|nr:hypothetical protein [Mycobacteroides abscessus]QSM03986.1 hypothetical protein PROPHIGD54-1_12 [Mycobacterium phage prophiGD54-1]MBE5420184.1 hypothetical protein [Mycobacteroides abscessus]MBE5455117.1 hypothetical protein [Mycobacteroides abscessus]MBN7296720.1 hypothetical protein [Mycobacteroides abscessus subsp. abscessus]MBN7329496.1 hypothetical protein [Mycobacteroides abscessus subsp. abscessus]
MNRPQPQLDPPRLELAAGLYDMAAWQLDTFLDDAVGYGISPQDAASLQLLVDLIRWQAQGYRRRAATMRADAEIVAAYFAGDPVVPDNPAAFEASISRSEAPPFPRQSTTIDYVLLQAVRDSLAEAHAVLSQGCRAEMTHAAKQAAALYSWCHPPLSV